MTPEQQELLYAGHFLLDRGYRYPEDFNGDTAIELVAKYIIEQTSDIKESK